MILHTLNKAAALDKCRDLLAPDDCLVLLEDGVYLAAEVSRLARCYAIEADLKARGFKDRLPPGVEAIDYRQLVRLTAQADKVCAWF